jgi:flagellar L-ring protein precursor FlgH
MTLRFATLLAALDVAIVLSGCQTLAMLPEVELVHPTQALPPVVAAAPGRPANGAIYQDGLYRPLFEDHRARLVGDTLTVQITEKISATQKATSTLDKTGSLDASITALPFAAPNSFKRANASGRSANSFNGKGVTENSNDFSGVITATVVQVLPNGHLIVSAEKQIGVNANVDVLRFSGQVDPKSIVPGNTVLSTQIANVRIEQRGRGQQAEAQSIGWLSRFFLNIMPI